MQTDKKMERLQIRKVGLLMFNANWPMFASEIHVGGLYESKDLYFPNVSGF